MRSLANMENAVLFLAHTRENEENKTDERREKKLSFPIKKFRFIFNTDDRIHTASNFSVSTFSDSWMCWGKKFGVDKIEEKHFGKFEII